jgi:hypothetical protein
MAIVPSYFGYLAEQQNLQAMIDNSLDNLQAQSKWRDWLDEGVPQMSLTFETAIGRDRIEAAASIVDDDAPAPLRSRNTIELLTGKIPSIKQKIPLKQSEMRDLEIIKALNIVGGNKAALLQKFYNDVANCATAGDKRVDIMTLQGVSNFSIDVSVTNNPDGVAYGTVDLLPRLNQAQGVPVVWSNTSGSKPVDDIETYLQFIWNTYGRQFGVLTMSYDLWLNFRRTDQVKSMLATFYNVGKQSATFAVTLDNVNEFFVANQWPPIEIINLSYNIEKDGKQQIVKPFNVNNVVFRPAGKVGTLVNAVSMEDLHRVTGKTYAKYGPTLVSKWAQSDPLIEWTGMEMLAFPAIDVDSIFILKTNTVQASFS